MIICIYTPVPLSSYCFAAILLRRAEFCHTSSELQARPHSPQWRPPQTWSPDKFTMAMTEMMDGGTTARSVLVPQTSMVAGINTNAQADSLYHQMGCDSRCRCCTPRILHRWISARSEKNEERTTTTTISQGAYCRVMQRCKAVTPSIEQEVLTILFTVACSAPSTRALLSSQPAESILS